jgi:hypothetical protein
VIMKSNILQPILKTLDRVLFGIEDLNEFEREPSELEYSENEEEFDVERSSN